MKASRYDLIQLIYKGLQRFLCDFARGCELCGIPPTDVALAEASQPNERPASIPPIDAFHVETEDTFARPLVQHRIELLADALID